MSEIVERTGGRANMIAIICNNIIKSIGKEKRVISLEATRKAIKEKNVYELFEAWRELTPNKPEANRLDRIIVYATIEEGEFKLGELIQKLKTYAFSVDIQALERSLDRLKVGYTLALNEEGKYVYRLPLFREHILKGEYEVKLKEEIKNYKH